MICYNVARRFFPMKVEADRYRVDLKMRPSALARIEVQSRADLAELLNSIAAGQTPAEVAGAVTPAASDEPEPPILAAIHDAEAKEAADAEEGEQADGFVPDDPDIPAFLKA